MVFADHFSSLAAQYAAFRPTYPEDLFIWLASISPSNHMAWDCACGNGQVSQSLVNYFDAVVATDGSASQITQAKLHPKIDYRVGLAEHSNLPPSAIDLITVGQAMHWFDLEKFYIEVRRVLKPKGVLAAWSCDCISCDNEVISEILRAFHKDILGPYWPPQIEIVSNKYKTIPFPFEEISVPDFVMQSMWSLSHVLGYLRSLSATNRYIEALSHDPVEDVEKKLAPAWGFPEKIRQITWPIYIRVGRVK